MHGRDLDPSPFARILRDLIARIPGARSAVLVDYEGETVDYAGAETPFELRVLGAELGLLARSKLSGVGALREIVVRGSKRSLILRVLPDGYALCVSMQKWAGFSRNPRAFSCAEQAIASEADWPHAPPEWHPVEVLADGRRPSRIVLGKVQKQLDILGTIAAPEVGFRVRTKLGWEATLVREPGCHWYASEAP